MKTWVCDDWAKGDNPKLHKGRPLERQCPKFVGVAARVWDFNRKEKKMVGVIFDPKNKCDCECHSSNEKD